MTDAERLTMALYRGALEDLVAEASQPHRDGYNLSAYVIRRAGAALRDVEALKQ